MTGAGRHEEMREVAREVLRELVPGMLREVITESVTQRNGHSGEHRARAHELDQDATVVPRVPAPPVAAVLRPSTWDRAAAPGEIIGRPAQADYRSGSGVIAQTSAHNSILNPSAQWAAQDSVLNPGGQPAAQDSVLNPGGQPAAQDSVSAPSAHPGVVNSVSTRANLGSDERVEVVVIDTDEDLKQFVHQLIGRVENPRERLALRSGRLRFTLRRSLTVAAAGGTGPRGPVTRVEKGAVTERVIRAAASAGTRLVLAPGTVLTPLARDQAKALGVQIERERRC